MPRTKTRTKNKPATSEQNPAEIAETAEHPRGDRTPDAILRQRVDQIRTALIAGATRTQILAVVAQMPAKNRRRIEKAKRAKKPEPDTSVWGVGDPPATRTVMRYMAIARKSLEKTGRKLPTMGEQIMGTQWARINMLFHAALKRERYHVCARLIEHTSTLFGLNGAVKLQLLLGDAKAEPLDDRPVASQTEAGALYEMRALLQAAMRRARAGGNALDPIATQRGAQN
jgi:hypothetical protein